MNINTSLLERLRVAASVDTNAVDLRLLARDGDQRVRCAVAANPSTTAATLSALARDDAESVRVAVAMNRRALGSTLTVLAEDAALAVRRAVAGNPSAPVPVRTELAAGDEAGSCRTVSAVAVLSHLRPPQTRLGTLLRYDEKRKAIVEVHPKLGSEIQRYIAENWTTAAQGKIRVP